MSTAPVIVFAYKRPALLQQVLRDLAANELADASDLIIYCDGPKPGASASDVEAIERSRSIAASTNGFRSVRVVPAEANKGLARSVIEGVTQVVSEHGRAIIVEEDVKLSPFFLRFMNDALEAYARDEQVWAVGAWNYFAPPEALDGNFFLRYPDSQSWAVWQRSWERFMPDGKALLDQLSAKGRMHAFNGDGQVGIYEEMLRAQVNGRIDSWAIRWTASCILNGGLCYYPRISLLRNMGIGADGTHETGSDHNAALRVAEARVAVAHTEPVENKKAFELWAAYAKGTFMAPPATLKTRLWRAVPADLRQWWTRRKQKGALAPELLEGPPVSRAFGFDRGIPIDRRYIELFLSKHADALHGHVMEIGEAKYMKLFAARIAHAEVLRFDGAQGPNERNGDLTRAETLPQGELDAFICTQTLNFIFDLRTAVQGLHASLKPGGAALVTVAALSPISRYDADRWGDFWRFTQQGAIRLFEEAFGHGQVTATAYGNSYAAACFIKGFAAEECDAARLDEADEDYPVVIGIKAVKR